MLRLPLFFIDNYRMIFLVIFIFYLLPLNSNSFLFGSLSKCWNGQPKCDINLNCLSKPNEWRSCLCEDGDEDCMDFYGNSLSEFIPHLLPINDPCGSNSTKVFPQCQPHLRCLMQHTEGISRCRCPGGADNTCSNPSTPTTSIPIPTASSGPLRDIGQQCGGKDYKGGTVCEPDLICLYQGEWSSVCLCPDKSWRCRDPTIAPKTTISPTVITSQSTIIPTTIETFQGK